MMIIGGIAPKHYSMTPQGVEELHKQLDDLKRRRRQVTEEMKEITSQTTEVGALEDSTLAMSHGQLTELDDQIALLERILSMAEVIPKPRRTGRVEVGSRVALSLDGQERTYTIVGALEADPLNGKISDESPLGRSLLGKRVHESCEVMAPARHHTAATIMRIE
jgi:transcription elongation factor GreA